MQGNQDSIELERTFPFQMNEVCLSARDNTNDIFHWHSYYEITLIMEGEACYFVNGQAFEVSAGDIILFNNAELHGWQVFGQEMRVMAMVFSPELISLFSGFSDTDYLKPFIERGANFKNRIGSGEPCAAEIARIMREIRQEWESRRVGYLLMIKADVLRILTLLVRHYHDDARGEVNTNRNKALVRLQAAFEYIDANYCGKVTLKEAADRVYMSPNYFSHFFHTATGISFSDYVTMRRVRKARGLLETTGMSIYEIAIECGFPNSSNFYRLYKKFTGKSPRRNH